MVSNKILISSATLNSKPNKKDTSLSTGEQLSSIIALPPPDTQVLFLHQTHRFSSSIRHTGSLPPPDTQVLFLHQTHRFSSSTRHTGSLPPSDTQVLSLHQTHRFSGDRRMN